MSETSELTARKHRVIVVDDVEVIATTLAVILNMAGFEARAVFSGKQVVEILDSFQPETLITDVVMPGMSGIEVAIVVRSRLPDRKILLFSASGESSDALPRRSGVGATKAIPR